MPSANLDLVRAIYAAWERSDWKTIEWAHPEIEYVMADGPGPGTTVGLAGMADSFRDWLGAWDEWRVEADDYRELDDERVLVPFHFSARGKASGLEVGQIWTKGATLFHVRDGKVTRVVQYMNRDHALADLNLVGEIGNSDGTPPTQ